MKVLYNWLKEMVDIPWAPDELAHRLTMIGLEVDVVRPIGTGLDQITVGKVKKREKHPDADKLSVCTVDVGDGEDRTIVCGAPNVARGQTVPVVLPGKTLPGGTVIGAAKLRGIASAGMICSEKELGLADAADGIMVLPKTWKPGTPLHEAYPFEDTLIEFELNPNRPDCFSHIGIARDIRGLTGNRVKPAGVRPRADEQAGPFKISIENPADCCRYAGQLMTGIKIKEAPFFIRQRLAALGLRPINNVVDITNYVLMEMGHPLHAFDAATLAGKEIRVRRARKGETLTAIDGTVCDLDETALVIADAEKPAALAGVMGGADTEVSGSTATILVESAWFNPTVVRKGARKYGFSTDASLRFERGMDPGTVLPAMHRTVDLIRKYAKGTCDGAVIDACPALPEPVTVLLRPARVCAVLGVDIPRKEQAGILKNLGCTVKKTDKETLQVTVPGFRVDLTREIDLVEEVARIYNFDNIGMDLRAAGSIDTKRNPDDALADAMRQALAAGGMREAVTFSMVPRKVVDKIDPGTEPVTIRNAISNDLNVLRTSLLTSLGQVVQHNVNRQCPDIRLFEVGSVFRMEEGNPVQHTAVGGAVCGLRRPVNWDDKTAKSDLYDLTGLLAGFCSRLGIAHPSFTAGSGAALEEGGIAVSAGGSGLGQAGFLTRACRKVWNIKEPVLYFELDFDALKNASGAAVRYRPLPKFPSLFRDISLLADAGTPVGDMAAAMTAAGGDLVAGVQLYDLYRGEGVGEGKKSLTFSVEYRSGEKTLAEDDVAGTHAKIIETVHKSFNAELRSV